MTLRIFANKYTNFYPSHGRGSWKTALMEGVELRTPQIRFNCGQEFYPSHGRGLKKKVNLDWLTFMDRYLTDPWEFTPP